MNLVMIGGAIAIILAIVIVAKWFKSSSRSKTNRYHRNQKKHWNLAEPLLNEEAASDEEFEYVKKITPAKKSQKILRSQESLQSSRSSDLSSDYSEDPDVILGLKEQLKEEAVVNYGENITKAEPPPKIEATPRKHPQLSPPIIIFYLMAQKDRPYSGYELLQALLSVGLRYGKMNIFHRYQQKLSRGEILFSLASAVEPGIFDLPKMGAFVSPGLTLFLDVSKTEDAVTAFDLMVETAEQLVDDLGGAVLDNTRKILSEDKIKELREQIQEYKLNPSHPDLFQGMQLEE